MKIFFRLFILIGLVSVADANKANKKQANIIVVLADELGRAELGG